jgi:hypothetical protein
LQTRGGAVDNEAAELFFRGQLAVRMRSEAAFRNKSLSFGAGIELFVSRSSVALDLRLSSRPVGIDARFDTALDAVEALFTRNCSSRLRYKFAGNVVLCLLMSVERLD